MKIDFEEFDKAYKREVQSRDDQKDFKNKRSNNKLVVITYSLLLIITFFTIANAINGNVELNQVKYSNIKLEEEINELNEEIKLLQVELDDKTSLAIIERVAREKIGLVQPYANNKIELTYTHRFALNENKKNDKVDNKAKR